MYGDSILGCTEGCACVYGEGKLDGSMQSRIMAMAFAMAAEIERDLISSRTKAALKARKEMGLPMGRPKGPGKSKLDQYRPEIEALLANGSTQKFIAQRYGTTTTNLNKYLIKRNISRTPVPFIEGLDTGQQATGKKQDKDKAKPQKPTREVGSLF